MITRSHKLQLEARVPANLQNDDLSAEVPSFETDLRSRRTVASLHHRPPPTRLHQNRQSLWECGLVAADFPPCQRHTLTLSRGFAKSGIIPELPSPFQNPERSTALFVPFR